MATTQTEVRNLSRMRLDLEVVHDGDPMDLADEVALIVRRALRERGAEVLCWGCGATPV